MKTVEWCCNGFKAQFNNQDERGLFVAVESGEGLATEECRFVLGARMVDRDKTATFGQTVKGLPNIPDHITLDCQTGMRFCPWCGCDLRKQYGKYWREMLKVKDK